MVENTEYTVRGYKAGDETKLTDLFNEVHKKYAGFVPRTPDYWNWCCLNRPTVEKDGICILEKSGDIIGYAVVEVATRDERVQATALEFCCHDVEAAKSLLKWLLDYVQTKEVDCVSLDAPADNAYLREAVREAGFTEFPHTQPLMKIIDYPQLMREIVAQRNSSLKECNGVFHFCLIDAKASEKGFTLEVEKDSASVELGKKGKPTVTVETDAETLTSCIFGVKSAMTAIFTSSIKVRPLWKFRKVVGLLSALKLEDPWFIPAGDFG